MVNLGEIVLEARGAYAAIARRGAEWRRWAVAGNELLWPGDAAVWPRVAPILFPIVGWLRDGRMRVGGRVYELGVHGFAADREFVIESQAQDRVTLVLTDSPATRSAYPFRFRFAIEYRLGPDAMDVLVWVTNTGEGALPYAVGLHPGFRWPLAQSQARHAVVFEKAEPAHVPRIAPGGLFSSQHRPIPLAGRVLPLSAELLMEEALCFLDAASRALLYDNGAGQGIAITLANFPHLAIWARPPAPFVAIEAWTGHGDPDDFDGDLFAKPSMIVLASGATARHAARYDFLQDAAGWR